MNKKKTSTVMVALAIVLLVVVAGGNLSVNPLTVYSYAKSVPIQIGHDEVLNYWILSAVVSETVAFKFVLGSETSESIGGDEEVKTKSEVGILVDPLPPISQTAMTDANIQFLRRQIDGLYEKSPSFDVNDAGWLTTARYGLGVYKNDVEVASQQVEINYQNPRVIELETGDGTVTVNNLGILPQGVEVPSGDLVLVYDPDGNKHVWNKANLIQMINNWNDGTTFPARVSLFEYGWDQVWALTDARGWLPQDVQLVHVSAVEIIGTHQYIKLTYAGIAFAGMISVYVPDELADTIIVGLSAPNPQIVSVTPDPLPSIEEGKSTVFNVEVRNVGTAGTVSISCSSTYYSFVPLTSTSMNMQPDQVFTFKFEAYALNVVGDVESSTKILVQGRGGSETHILTGTIKNVEGYTPTVPEPTYTTLNVHVVDTAYAPINEIAVTVTFGGANAIGVTNVDGDVQFDLSQYTGDIKLATMETAEYPSKTVFITVQLGTNEHTITLGASPLDLGWLLWVAVAAVAFVVVFKVFKKRGRKGWG